MIWESVGLDDLIIPVQIEAAFFVPWIPPKSSIFTTEDKKVCVKELNCIKAYKIIEDAFDKCIL